MRQRLVLCCAALWSSGSSGTEGRSPAVAVPALVHVFTSPCCFMACRSRWAPRVTQAVRQASDTRHSPPASKATRPWLRYKPSEQTCMSSGRLETSTEVLEHLCRWALTPAGSQKAGEAWVATQPRRPGS